MNHFRRMCRSFLSLAVFLGLFVSCRVWSQDGNFALGRPVISSAQVVPGNPVESLTDGNRRTFTHPNATSGTRGFYYQIDLGRVRVLDRIALWSRPDCCAERLRRYRVTIFADGGNIPGQINWSGDVRMDGTYVARGTADTIVAGQGAGVLFGGRYLRIENLGGDGSSPQIAEVEAWPAAVPVIRRFDTDAGNLTVTGQAGRPGTAVLGWQVDNGTTLSIAPEVGPLATATGTLTVSPDVTTTYTLSATNAAGTTTATLVIGVDEPETPPLISEFLASPDGTYFDDDDESVDWIEIANPNVFALNLKNYSLSDDPARLARWVFPSVTVPARGHLVVFASGKARWEPGAPAHTNFSLKTDGDFLALTAPDGVTVLSQFPATFPVPASYPEQSRGRSYGLDEGGRARYFSPATPGEPNGAGFLGVVENPVFSVNRGVFTGPQTVAVSTSTPGATLRYTLDGSAPSATTGLVYAAPLTISTTTVLRVIAVKDGFAPTAVMTQTYIFPEGVKASSVMRTSITRHATYGPQVIPALTDLPSLSMVTPLAIPNGVDVPASLEFIVPNGAPGEGFQENCGVERFGGDYTDFAKKSFRFHFRKSYGNGRLNYPIFKGFERGLAAVTSFNSLDLRNGSHDMVDRGFYLSNPFTDAVMLDMGQLSPHGRWVHLYYNGTYWGVYHLRERWDADMQSDYLGGQPEDYESINGNLNVGGWAEPGDPYDGDGSAWARIKSLRGNYAQVKSYLNVPNYVDYMLTFMFGDSEDEYRASGTRAAGSGFRFMINDADGWLRTSAGNNTTRSAPGRQHGDGPGSIFSMLYKEANPDYRMLLADRIQKHMLNGGALTQARNVARIDQLADALERPFIVESARWNYRTPSSWLTAKNQIRNSWLNTRSTTVIGQYRSAGFFPSLAAPLFSQRGGPVAAGARIALTGTLGTIYYTDDGSDPRLSGGALAPSARAVPTGVVTEPMVAAGARWRWFTDQAGLGASNVVVGQAGYDATHWKHPDFDDTAWVEGPAELGYGEDDEATVLPFGDPVDRYRTVYFRHAFSLPVDSTVTAATLRLKRDDGVIAYINGVERARDGLIDVVTGESLALTAADDGKNFLSFTVPPAAFRSGRNVLAVELHQSTASSSDASFDAELVVTRTTGGDSGVEILRNTLVRARTRNASQWSALDEAFFQVAATPVAPGEVVFSELNYHPGTAAAEEFVELQNISTAAVNLRGCRLTEGIEYSFPDNRDTFLGPGQRLVVVEDIFAFQQKYGLEVPVMGRYAGRLANQGGGVVLVAPGGAELARARYDDIEPWPSGADGGGWTLVRRPGATDQNQAASWWSSAAVAGTPGGTDTLRFQGDPDGDGDRDGVSALVEHALGTSDADSASGSSGVQAGPGGNGAVMVVVRRNLRAEDVVCRIETSLDLDTWLPSSTEPTLVSQVAHGDSTVTETWAVAVPASANMVFVRVRVEPSL